MSIILSMYAAYNATLIGLSSNALNVITKALNVITKALNVITKAYMLSTLNMLNVNFTFYSSIYWHIVYIQHFLTLQDRCCFVRIAMSFTR